MVFRKKLSKFETALRVLSANDNERPTLSDPENAATTETPASATSPETTTGTAPVVTEAGPVPVVAKKPTAEEKAQRDATRAAQKAEKATRATQDFENRYAHVVSGSVRLVPKGDVVDGVMSKGKMATVRCVDCGTERSVNVQDVFQSKRCRPCYQAAQKSKKQAARANAKTDATPTQAQPDQANSQAT